MTKLLSVILAFTLLFGCKSNNDTQAKTSSSVKTAAVKGNVQGTPIFIHSNIPFSNPDVVATNIKDECTQLGNQFSESTIKYASEHRINVKNKEVLNKSDSGKVLIVTMTNAFSSGNAFLGHHKSVSTKAELFKDGKLIDTYTGTRNSGGGFFGGFKGSCSVLHRTVNTLGSDIAKWLKKNNYHNL